MPDNSFKILYIAGSGRSGSTLLERILGQLDDFAAAGELKHIWLRGFMEDQLCGCGEQFSQCSFWQEVRQQAGLVDGEALENLRLSVDRVRFLPKMIHENKEPVYQERWLAYLAVLKNLYQAIAHVSGKRVIIDSSKDPSTAYLLALSGMDVSIIHLTRDSRAVAYSWQRKKIRPEITGQASYMRTYKPSRSALEWNYYNSIIQSIPAMRKQLPYLRMRYEDFVVQPENFIREILSLLNIKDQEMSFLSSQRMLLKPNHSVSGNPFRFEKGPVELKADLEWREKFNRRDFWIVTALTAPLLLYYCYPLLPKPQKLANQPELTQP